MLDQPNIHNPVELAFNGPVVEQFEPHSMRYPSRFGSLTAKADLIGRKRDADDFRVVVALQIQRHAAPAATDIKYLHARLKVELGCDMCLLVQLSLLEALRIISIISGGVLEVFIEKKLV